MTAYWPKAKRREMGTIETCRKAPKRMTLMNHAVAAVADRGFPVVAGVDRSLKFMSPRGAAARNNNMKMGSFQKQATENHWSWPPGALY